MPGHIVAVAVRVAWAADVDAVDVAGGRVGELVAAQVAEAGVRVDAEARRSAALLAREDEQLRRVGHVS